MNLSTTFFPHYDIVYICTYDEHRYEWALENVVENFSPFLYS